MRTTASKGLTGTCLAAALLLASCDSFDFYHVHGRGRGHGPPAHAKAHGYRNKQVCGYDLVYDPGCGMYTVVGLSDCWYHDGHFYRVSGGVWQISLRATEWRVVSHEGLPPGLRVKAGALAKGKPRGGMAKVHVPGNGNAKVQIQGNGSVKAKGSAKFK